MESSEDAEVLSRTIERLLHEKRKREATGDPFIEDNDDHLLLSRLFSQLESSSLKPSKRTDETSKEDEGHYLDSSPSKGKSKGQRHLEESVDEIAKDIRKMKRQNRVIQVLLSTMILLTLTWQVSEYSMLFILKDRLCHPVRTIVGMLSGLFKGKTRQIKNQLQETSTSSDQDNGTISGSHLQMPEVLREFAFKEDKD